MLKSILVPGGHEHLSTIRRHARLTFQYLTSLRILVRGGRPSYPQGPLPSSLLLSADSPLPSDRELEANGKALSLFSQLLPKNLHIALNTTSRRWLTNTRSHNKEARVGMEDASQTKREENMGGNIPEEATTREDLQR